MHIFVHSFCDVVAERFDLLANIFEEDVARPAPDHHYCEDGHLVEVHCHGAPDLIEWVPKSPFLTPRDSHPMASAAVSIALTICFEVMCSILLFFHTAETGVLSLLPWYLLIRLINEAQDLTGHMDT